MKSSSIWLIIFAWCSLAWCQTSPSVRTTILSVDDLVDQIIKNQSNVTIEDFTNNDDISDYDSNSGASSSSNRIPSSSSSWASGKRINFSLYVPGDFLNSDFKNKGGFVIHILIFIYLCLVLTLIIDSYFVPSLQRFIISYDLSPNIVGSTLMVFGTSLPELFLSVIRVFIGGLSIGTGALVVSSIFNNLAIPGFCGLLTLSPSSPFMSVNSWPIKREIIFFSITIITFTLGIKDDSIDWLESLVFIFIYSVYMFCLYLWSHFEITQQINRRRFLRSKDRHWLKYTHYLQQSKINVRPSRTSSTVSNSTIIDTRLYNGRLKDNSILKYPLMPFIWVFSASIPKASKRTFIATYIISSIYIVILTYFLIWMIYMIGETFHLTQSGSVMTMLALGNIAKLISSIIVVKRLHLPEMALCHAIGSNIFNILICLGLPWFLKIFTLTVTEGSTLQELQQYTIPLDECLFEYVVTSLTLLLVTFNLIFYLNDWKLTFKSSFFFIAFYINFLACIVIFDQYISIV